MVFVETFSPFPHYACRATFVSFPTPGQMEGSLDFTPLLREGQLGQAQAIRARVARDQANPGHFHCRSY